MEHEDEQDEAIGSLTLKTDPVHFEPDQLDSEYQLGQDASNPIVFESDPVEFECNPVSFENNQDNFYSDVEIESTDQDMCIGNVDFEYNEDDVQLDPNVLVEPLLQELCLLLSNNQLSILADVFNIINYSTERRLKLNLPSSLAGFRRRYTEGKRSLSYQVKQKLQIEEDKDENDARTYYVPIMNIVKIHLTKLSISAEEATNDRYMYTTQLNSFVSHRMTREKERIQQLIADRAYDHNPELINIHLFGYIWSDGFDSNSCKRMRGSSWVQTITLFQHESLKYTYIYAIGPDDANRNQCQTKLVEQLCDFYDGKQVITDDGRNVMVYFTLMAYLADQPERRKVNGLLQGNSIYHGRWGHLFPYGRQFKDIQPCSKCKKLLLSNQGCRLMLRRERMDSSNTEPCCLLWSASGDRITFAKLRGWASDAVFSRIANGTTNNKIISSLKKRNQ